ncbi:MAG TPA: hypothetical protein VK821_15980 [Dehalococcoidia bacterium]|nr:hypothetical protein [Dehalococcoidia bacterium]
MIASRWPAASFAVSRGEDPEGLYLDATVDLDDPDEVMDLVVDRLLRLQVNERLPVHVVPLRTPERAAALRQPRRPRKPYAAATLETLLRPTP